MVLSHWVRLSGAGCIALLGWLISAPCVAQHDAAATARSELSHFSSSSQLASPVLSPAAPPSLPASARNPWLYIAASTTAAFATGLAFFQGFAFRANRVSTNELDRSRDVSLDIDARNRARSQGLAAEQRADLLDRVSSICLAGTVAATGATLLIWLTSKHRRQERQQPRLLLGPMVLRSMSGAGLVLREKF